LHIAIKNKVFQFLNEFTLVILRVLIEQSLYKKKPFFMDFKRKSIAKKGFPFSN
jgi:hypothetical protein